MDLVKIRTITIGFIIVNVFVSVFVHAILGSSYSLGPTERYDFLSYLLLSVMIGVIAGVLGGVVIVRINKQLFRKKSFGVALFITAIVFAMVFLIVNIISSIVTAKFTMSGDTINELIANSIQLMFNPLTLAIFSLWGAVTLITLFLLQVSDKFGPGKLWKFIRGHYFHPVAEDRVFMFADLRSSTSIAEKISHTNYFQLLSNLFADITDPILDHEGEIYQYVGDEIVVTWPLAKAVQNNNCLNCFRAIEQKLKDLGPLYKERFGVTPELKAGVHHGSVTAGEIGIIKKDIVYTGDVLNTTARIQEQCNSYDVNLLISDETIYLFDLSDIVIKKLGNISLRGKIAQVGLVTI